MKVLISAYACGPHGGSEPGVGWNVACEMATRHQVYVLTRMRNREAIQRELEARPRPTLQFIFDDLPEWLSWWQKGGRGERFYYHLWQIKAFFTVRRLYPEVKFDLIHHVTWVRYWSPSFLSLLPIPFVWGPVGGGERTPKNFWYEFSVRGKIYETLRAMAQWAGECDPFVRLTARRSRISIATTRETAQRLERLQCKRIKVFGESGLADDEIQVLQTMPLANGRPFRFISMGRLLHWKGFHLGIRAFAKASLPSCEYWILGDGPERKNLEKLARDLNIDHRVHFFGLLSREDALEKLSRCHVLVHPSLHDSGGWVCLEAMASGRPVICLDLGGPRTQVTDLTGFKIPALNPDETVRDMAEAMHHLATNPLSYEKMSQAARDRITLNYRWRQKGEVLNGFYTNAVQDATSL